MSLEVLKHALDYKFFSTNRDLLNEELFPTDVKKLYRALKEYYEFHPANITAGELKSVFLSKYPALSAAELRNYDILFSNLAATVVSEETANAVLKIEKLKQNAAKLATEALNIADGKHRNFELINSLVKELQKEYKSVEERFVNITDDIDELMRMGENRAKWKFCLPIFEEKLGGVGPGVFGHVAGRPNSGKTAFVISSIFHPDNGWLKQGAKVALFGNEEDVFLHKRRGMACYSGKEEEAWVDEKIRSEVREKFCEIKDNLYTFDSEGQYLSEVEEWIDRHKPDVIVIDQLDKVRLSGNFGAKHEEIRELYTQVREVGKKQKVAIVGIGQASTEADGKLYYGFDMLEHSKTGKAAETDFIITIGKEGVEKSKDGDDGFRIANICKNKLTGKECSVSFMLNTKLSRIYQ